MATVRNFLRMPLATARMPPPSSPLPAATMLSLAQQGGFWTQLSGRPALIGKGL